MSNIAMLSHDRPVITIAECVRLSGVSRPTVVRYLRDGTIRGVKRGGRVLIDRVSFYRDFLCVSENAA